MLQSTISFALAGVFASSNSIFASAITVQADDGSLQLAADGAPDAKGQGLLTHADLNRPLAGADFEPIGMYDVDASSWTGITTFRVVILGRAVQHDHGLLDEKTHYANVARRIQDAAPEGIDISSVNHFDVFYFDLENSGEDESCEHIVDGKTYVVHPVQGDFNKPWPEKLKNNDIDVITNDWNTAGDIQFKAFSHMSSALRLGGFAMIRDTEIMPSFTEDIHLAAVRLLSRPTVDNGMKINVRSLGSPNDRRARYVSDETKAWALRASLSRDVNPQMTFNFMVDGDEQELDMEMSMGQYSIDDGKTLFCHFAFGSMIWGVQHFQATDSHLEYVHFHSPSGHPGVGTMVLQRSFDTSRFELPEIHMPRVSKDLVPDFDAAHTRPNFVNVRNMITGEDRILDLPSNVLKVWDLKLFFSKAFETGSRSYKGVVIDGASYDALGQELSLEHVGVLDDEMLIGDLRLTKDSIINMMHLPAPSPGTADVQDSGAPRTRPQHINLVNRISGEEIVLPVPDDIQTVLQLKHEIKKAYAEREAVYEVNGMQLFTESEGELDNDMLIDNIRLTKDSVINLVPNNFY